MPLVRSKFCFVILCQVCLFANLAVVRHAMAQPTANAEIAAKQNVGTDQIAVGIDGHFRVGCWTGIHCTNPQVVPTRIETEDGDGVSVAYVHSYDAQSTNHTRWAYAIPGSEEAPLVVECSDGNRVATRFASIGSPSRGSAQIPLGMPWVVSIGNPMGVEQFGANEILRRDASVAVSIPDSAAGLPDSVLGYEGIDLLMIGGSGAAILERLDPSQRDAIVGWIEGGGRVLLTLGESLPELKKAAPWLLELIPSPTSAVSGDSSIDDWITVEFDPSAIETFTSTQTPLTTFRGAKLPKGVGDSIVIGRTTRRVSAPIAVEYVVGFGEITIIAADLDKAPFVDWPQRTDLITQLTGKLFQSNETPLSTINRATAYDDLAGQMRATLDHFPTQRRFPFSIVSLILIGLIALIGPLDYFLVNRLLGKPLLGWLTFPVMAIGISALLVMQAKPILREDPKLLVNSEAPDRDTAAVPVNRIEIVDIDVQSQLGESFAWSVLYSHDANRLDVESAPADSLSQFSHNIKSIITAPFGFPGRSFGAIQVTGENARLPNYEVRFDTREGQRTTEIVDLPMAPRSSKSVATRIRFEPNLAEDIVLSRRSGTELLEGTLVNPLPVDLLNGILIYRNWAYLLPTRFPKGERIESIDVLRQKNFRWQLSRQKALESSTETQVWNPSMTDNPERLAEMLMFHNTVGGSRYTTLNDRVLSFLDRSHLLIDDRCILVGRLAKPSTQMELSSDDAKASIDDNTLTLMRLVIPVKNKRRL
ncbi:hypothetical protein CA13_43840 [Planctomycetes bacterium CA13]|uniref:DUF4350 domain-containing protein n=1 Tax=Novipirellula herctigrandis TaxID=2527986 RepID=A0A5C5Z7W0_9BACT|nr:hypothetical protein CA13_43840 [Planctomycetes bacterium CA13]